jgi:hypothetical protein
MKELPVETDNASCEIQAKNLSNQQRNTYN